MDWPQFILFTLASFVSFNGAPRQVLKPVFNPGCPERTDCSHIFNRTEESINNLVYYVSDGSNDRLHFIFSTVDGFTMLFAKSSLNSTLSIDWDAFLAKNFTEPSILIDKGEVQSSFTLSITKLYRYDYTTTGSDTVELSRVQPIELSNIFWANATLNMNDFSIRLKTSNESSNLQVLGLDGALEITFEVFDESSHFYLMPRLLHNDLSAQLDIELKNLTSLGYNNTRYSVELAIITSVYDNNDVLINNIATMNDESTPGIFETDVLVDVKDDAYVMWKPVCYTKSERSLTSISEAHHTALSLIDKTENNSTLGSLALAFYGLQFSKKQTRSFNVSLGSQNDKFYSQYMAWTLQIGAGQPPQDSFSPVVVSMMVLCILAPGGALLTGAWYGISTKFRVNV